MGTLGEPDEEDDTAAWLQKFDLIREEKEKAEKRVDDIHVLRAYLTFCCFRSKCWLKWMRNSE